MPPEFFFPTGNDKAVPIRTKGPVRLQQKIDNSTNDTMISVTVFNDEDYESLNKWTGRRLTAVLARGGTINGTADDYVFSETESYITPHRIAEVVLEGK